MRWNDLTNDNKPSADLRDFEAISKNLRRVGDEIGEILVPTAVSAD